jgi:chemosensory pili system protein ChpC
MSDHKELYSLLIPLREERLLVPRMCVAEVIAFAAAARDPGSDDACPEWYLGTIDWNGRRIPIVSFDREGAEVEGRKAARRRIVVFHAVTGLLKGGYYGILTQGFPQLVRVNPDVVRPDPEAELPDEQPVLCRVRMIHEFPLIPDVERLETMLADLAEAA